MPTADADGGSAVVLLSGGLDSLISAHLSAREYDLRLAVTADYGQRAAPGEIVTAGQQAAGLGIEHQVVELPWLGALSPSALTEAARAIPHPSQTDLDDAETAAQTAEAVWVPNRNGVLLMVAAAYAEALGCDAVIMGINAEEGATFPDNTPEFARAGEHLLELSTANSVGVVCPVVGMTKTEMVVRARELEIPLTHLHSCYEAGPGHCWECESCRRLQRALEQADAWASVSPHLDHPGR